VAIGLLLPSVVSGWSGNLDLLGEWLRTLRDSTTPNLLNSDNVSIAAMWAKWAGPGSLATGFASLTIVGVLALAIVAWRALRWPARGYFHVTSIPNKCMETSRFGLFFGFC
jgi:hypothetical protein